MPRMPKQQNTCITSAPQSRCGDSTSSNAKIKHLEDKLREDLVAKYIYELDEIPQIDTDDWEDNTHIYIYKTNKQEPDYQGEPTGKLYRIPYSAINDLIIKKVNRKLSELNHLSFIIVDKLPDIISEADPSKIYLLKKAVKLNSKDYIYDEYIIDTSHAVDWKWVMIGSTSLNLTEYRTALEEDEENNKIKELIETHKGNLDNPHNVTKSQVGLDEVDNTSDENKPISIAQQAKFDEISQKLAEHSSNNNNPHSVTKEQIGLGNVENLSPSQLISDPNSAVYTKFTEIEQTITTKQDQLVSEGTQQNIKTINGQSILGAGDIKLGGSNIEFTPRKDY